MGLSSERLQQVNALVKRHLDAKSFAGAVTLVARNGRIVHLQAQGMADLESKQPMQTDSMFRIMSMTKPVVGVAILMMMEEGKVRLNDPVSKFIPALKGLQVAVSQPAPGPPPAAGTPAEPRYYTVPADHEITVRELLTHTSGLVSGTISNSANRKVVLKGARVAVRVLPRLAQTPLEFQPGTRWAYSAQAGFDVLLHIVEIASGQPADVFLKQRIFDPLGMKDTFFYPVENPRLAGRYDRQPDGTLRRNSSTPNFLNGRYFSGGGGLASTAEDYFQFAQMLLNGGQLNGKRLLSPRERRDDGVGDRARHAAGPPGRRVVRPQRARREQPGGPQHVPVAGQLRVERRLRHPLLDRPEGEGDRHPDDADAEPGDSGRL